MSDAVEFVDAHWIMSELYEAQAITDAAFSLLENENSDAAATVVVLMGLARKLITKALNDVDNNAVLTAAAARKTATTSKDSE